MPMPLEPTDWSVVLAGAWNRAILTPAGIGKRVLGLESGTALAIEVPVDAVGPYRVRHDSLVVTVGSGRLTVYADPPTNDNMQSAMTAGVTALKSLPVTPVRAVGYNFRYRTREPSPEFIRTIECNLDNVLSHASFEISHRRLSRSLNYEGGVVNVEVSGGDNKYEIALNFHMDSSGNEDNTDLIRWLAPDWSKLKDTLKRIVNDVFCADVVETQHD